MRRGGPPPSHFAAAGGGSPGGEWLAPPVRSGGGAAARGPDAFAWRDSRRRLTWAELLALVDAVAADLDAAGLKRGERVAVWLPNRVEAVAVQLACSRQGYVCNPSLHRNYTVAEKIGKASG